MQFDLKFRVMGYNQLRKDKNNGGTVFVDCCYFDIYAETPAEAIKAAKEIYKMKYYRIDYISQYIDGKKDQERQFKIQQDLIEAMKNANDPKKPWEK